MAKRVVIYYRIAPHNGSAVFALKERAELVARIHTAMGTAETWSEFRALMPRKEYSKILAIIDDSGEPRPKGSDPFTAEQVPGFSDGDYPPWLQSEMNTLFKWSTLEQFGARKDTFLNGSFWEIAADKADDLAEYLRAHGAIVTKRQDLEFH